jgi:O-antigen biosynthesis alpha-1,3-abequosyltransferase
VSKVKLSICMPTYNFGAFIGETLDSIVSQLQPEVEVVVLDGGSTDDTEAVVKAYIPSFPQVSYVRQATRGGIDRDMARSVDLAQGEYCWLFSSDDIMKPGAVRRVLAEISSGLDVYLCGLTLCDKQMKVLMDHAVSSAPWGAVFNLSDSGERGQYFAAAQTTTAFFSFMGSIIVRRARWHEQSLDEEYVGSCWAHAVRIMRMIPRGLTVKYLGESLLFKRGENDSFMDKGLIHRYAIAIDGFHRIAADVFGEKSNEAFHIRRVISNEFPLRAMFFTRMYCRDQGRAADIPELGRLVAKVYRDRTALNVVRRIAYHRMGEVGYRFARSVYRALRRMGLFPKRRTKA